MNDVLLELPVETSDQPDVEFGTMINFQRTVTQLNEDLGRLRDYSGELGLNESVDLIHNVVERLRDGRFVVAVVGEFKIGKSTFLNALMGADILPTDVVPATAALSRVTYGLEERIVVYFKGRRPPENIGIHDLGKFVTKVHDGGELAKTVDECVVHYNVPFLMNNVDIIDTPGLNDEEAMDEATLRVLPKADACILLISALAPFGAATREFLESRLLTSDIGRVVFVVNMIGKVHSDEDADRVIAHVEKSIRERVIQRAEQEYGKDSPEFEAYFKKIGKPRVFGVDSYAALKGKQDNDRTLLEKSRFPRFVPNLERFLTQDRGAIVLQVPVNRALASSNEILAALSLREEALKMSAVEFDQKYTTATAELKKLQEQKTQEIRQLNQRKDEFKKTIPGRVKGVNELILGAMMDAVQNYPLTDGDVSSDEARKKTIKNLNPKVKAAGQQTAERLIERVTVDLNKSVMTATRDLEKFTLRMDATIGEISQTESSRPGSNAATAIAVFTGLGGIYSGYEKAGIPGAVVGGIGSVATAIAAGFAIGVLGLPFTLPVLIGTVLLSWFGGARIADKVYRGKQAEQFRENYAESLRKDMEPRDIEIDLSSQLQDYVEKVFSSLRDKADREISAVLNNTQETLNSLKSQRDRNEALSAEQARNYREIRERTQLIQDSAARLNRQLIQLMTV